MAPYIFKLTISLWLTRANYRRQVSLPSGKHVRDMYTPLLYSKTGVCRGIPIFLIFAPKHRLWVHVRTASAVPTIYVLSKNKKNIKNFLQKILPCINIHQIKFHVTGNTRLFLGLKCRSMYYIIYICKTLTVYCTATYLIHNSTQ